MNLSARSKLTNLLTAIIAAIILIVPFHAILTVWLGSNFGHYTAWRLWDETLLIIATLLTVILATTSKQWNKLFKQQVIWLMAAYALLELTIGAVALYKHDVTTKALGYGLIVDLRFFLFFAVCLVAVSNNDWLKRNWKQLLLIPGAVVVSFGLLQHFALSYDFLRHFGYGQATIMPYETINHNLNYVRIMSTLRGSNPLGAYLVLVISAITVLFTRAKNSKWRWIYGLFGIASAATLFYSYSRSAWIGAALGVAIAVWFSIKTPVVRYWLAGIATGLVIVAGLSAFALRNNTMFENIFTHTQQHSAIKTTSDQGHASALKTGLHDAIHQPLGDGPGTAGPASVYNRQPARIAENYFVQIAQEVGWLGLIIFLMILWLLFKALWHQRQDALSLTLLAALVGISFVNLLSHAWVDDTLAYLWWGLAGIALAPVIKQSKNHKKP